MQLKLKNFISNILFDILVEDILIATQKWSFYQCVSPVIEHNIKLVNFCTVGRAYTGNYIVNGLLVPRAATRNPVEALRYK